MSKYLILLDTTCFALALLLLSIVWTTNIDLDPQIIATVLNGLTSSVSLMIGFTATVIAITFSKSEFRPLEDGNHIKGAITFLGLAGLLLVVAFFELLKDSNFQSALRFALSSLTIGVTVLFDFLGYLLDKMEKMK